MKILLIGNGAREHAIAWKLMQSPLVDELVVAPGNAGTAQLAANIPINSADIDALLAYALQSSVDLTVVGPEIPLAAGIADRFADSGCPVFGPTQAAAKIESSKIFAKTLMVANRVPTAEYREFSSYDAAEEYVAGSAVPIVIKADGLAAGKGVVVAQTHQEAQDALRSQMIDKSFGSSGDRVVIEECLVGREVSVFAFVDGEYVSPMTTACDYKRIGDGDQGPNTGGMGSFSPTPFWSSHLEEQVRMEIMERVASALVAAGTPFQGILYAGLMLTDDGPKVIEFNCRHGDPEAQVVLPRLRGDLAEIMLATAEGRLSEVHFEWDPNPCVGVVMASGGYPGEYETGFPVMGLDQMGDDITVFHAGTREASDDRNASPVTSGGRVLTVTSTGQTMKSARANAYENVKRVKFENAYYRRDIAAIK